MEIHVQMRAVNLYTLTRKIDNEIYVMYEMGQHPNAMIIGFILFRYLILERNLICLKLEITKLL